MTRLRRIWPWWRWVLTGLSALALALSAYLGWHYVVGGSLIGCSGGSPCDQVLGSRWSAVGGVLPVSGLAAGAYLAMLLASFYLGPDTEASVRRIAWRALLILVGAAAGSAVWFIMVQKWAIGSFCPYCLATHLTSLLLAALVVSRAPMQFEDDSTEVPLTKPAAGPGQDDSPAAPKRLIRRGPAIGLLLAGVTLAGIMAVCQAAFPPPPVYRGGESPDALPALDHMPSR